MKNFYGVSFLSILLIFLFTNTNIAQWTQIGLPNEVVNCLALSQDSTVCFAGTNNLGIYSSSDRGNTWQRRDGGTINFSVNAINTEARRNTAYLAGTNNGMYVSSDQGNTWFSPTTLTGLKNTHINTLCWDSNNNVILGTNGGVFYLPDKSSNFAQSTSGISDSLINAIYYDYPNPGYTWCGTSAGLYVSTNYGTTWSKRTNVTTPVHCIIVAGLMMAGSENGIYETGNVGPRYNVVGPWSANSSESWFQSMTMGPPSNPTPLFLGTQGNGLVYCSFNMGAHCDNKSTGLISNGSVNALVYVGQYLIAGTNNGLWRRKISEVTGVELIKSPLPTSYSLDQNYPNPFNPSTAIIFSIPKEVIVQLKVYDLLGREVTTLVNEEKVPGNYEVKFSGNNFSSGIYYYRIQAGEFTQTKKMILLK